MTLRTMHCRSLSKNDVIVCKDAVFNDAQRNLRFRTGACIWQSRLLDTEYNLVEFFFRQNLFELFFINFIAIGRTSKLRKIQNMRQNCIWLHKYKNYWKPWKTRFGLFCTVQGPLKTSEETKCVFRGNQWFHALKKEAGCSSEVFYFFILIW